APDCECVLRTAADVINLARSPLDVLRSETQGPDEILDKQHVPDLLAVPINRQGPSGRRCNDEMRQPSLIFVAELPRAVDATHSKDHRWQVIDSGVVAHILVSRPFRAAVRGMEVQRPRLGNAMRKILKLVASVSLPDDDVFETAVHLVRRCEYDRGSS